MTPRDRSLLIDQLSLRLTLDFQPPNLWYKKDFSQSKWRRRRRGDSNVRAKGVGRQDGRRLERNTERRRESGQAAGISSWVSYRGDYLQPANSGCPWISCGCAALLVFFFADRGCSWSLTYINMRLYVFSRRPRGSLPGVPANTVFLPRQPAGIPSCSFCEDCHPQAAGIPSPAGHGFHSLLSFRGDMFFSCRLRVSPSRIIIEMKIVFP